jgi:hypothetical protein
MKPVEAGEFSRRSNMKNNLTSFLFRALAVALAGMAGFSAQAETPNEANPVAGKWRSTTVAGTQYKDSYTNAPAPISGHSFFYEFLPDNTYRYNGLLQITTYGCTSSVYGENTGHYRVQGDKLIVEPESGTVKSRVCGGQPKEKPDNLQVREYVFRVENVGAGQTLVINGVDGKNKPDYFRREAN